MIRSLSGIGMGFVTLFSSIFLLNSCAGQVIASQLVDITQVGKLNSSTRMVFKKCSIRVDRYEGANGISLENCPKEATIKVSEGNQLKTIRVNDVYIFAKGQEVNLSVIISAVEHIKLDLA